MNDAAQTPLNPEAGQLHISAWCTWLTAVQAKTVEYVVKGVKAKTVAVTYVNNEYGRELPDTFKKLYEEQGGKIVANEIFAIGETDFTTHPDQAQVS